jgi:methionine synthase II (cobalamin-independent)
MKMYEDIEMVLRAEIKELRSEGTSFSEIRECLFRAVEGLINEESDKE